MPKVLIVGIFLYLTFCGPAIAEVTPLPISDTQGDVFSTLDPTVESNRVYAIGRAEIYGGDLQAARKAALQAAYGEAVARGAGVSIGSMTMVRNVQQVTDFLLSESQGFISSYDVAHEGIKEDGQVYEIGIEATVERNDATTEESRLRGLRLYLQMIGNPSILIVLPQMDTFAEMVSQMGEYAMKEQTAGTQTRHENDPFQHDASGGYSVVPGSSTAPGGVIQGSEAAIAQALSRFGYSVTTSDELSARRAMPQALIDQARSGMTNAAIEVGRLANADIVLVGAIQFAGKRITPAGVQFDQVTGEASAKAIIISSGQNAKTFYGSSTKAHNTLLGAASKVKVDLAEKFAQELAWDLPKVMVNNPRTTNITFDGFSANAVLEISNLLRSENGVQGVQVANLPSASSSFARLEIQSGFVPLSAGQIYELVKRHSAQAELLNSSKFTYEFGI